MATMTMKLKIIAGFLGVALLGCKPEGPPPDLIKPQRDALNKAKAVEGQLQHQAEQQKQTVEDEQK